jgi:hypothetical protein
MFGFLGGKKSKDDKSTAPKTKKAKGYFLELDETGNVKSAYIAEKPEPVKAAVSAANRPKPSQWLKRRSQNPLRQMKRRSQNQLRQKQRPSKSKSKLSQTHQPPPRQLAMAKLNPSRNSHLLPTTCSQLPALVGGVLVRAWIASGTWRVR